MMVMSNSGHDSGALSKQSSSTWESVLASVSQSFVKGAPEEELRAGLRLWCDEARRRDLLPEAFLPVLKSQLLLAPGLRRRTRDLVTRDRAMQRLVTMCIEEYYASDGEQTPR